MAVSAYASLVSLTHLLDNVHYRAQHHRLHVDILQIETLQGSVHFLLDFVEANSEREGENITCLWRQISEFAFEAEETFDSNVTNQLLCQCKGETSSPDMISAFSEDVDRLIQKVELIKDELSDVTTERVDVLHEKLSKISLPRGGSQPSALDGQHTLVGFEEHVVKIMDRLTSYESKLQITPIIGMGGIGKTTLARHVYDSKLIVDHFDLRIWLTISQDHNVQRILQGLLDDNKESGASLYELGEKLHKTLYGRRYLIVVDDVWTTESCYDLMRYFPDNGNGSRILMTTRLLDIAACLGCQNPCLINFLNNDESWSLLCQKIFSQDSCPHSELEDIGKDIAKSCRGLPLAIVAIGRQLARSNMTREYWEFARENIYSFGNLGDDDHSFKILFSSYKSLPIYMKPCFLYLRVFPEDSEIEASLLIRSWVAEGFIKQIGDKSLEDLAREYVNDLIDRNLLFVCERLIDGKVWSCGIHDLFLELCIQESEKECFLSTPKIQCLTGIHERYSCSLCGESTTNEDEMDDSEIDLIPSSASAVSIYICDMCRIKYSNMRRPKLVRAMDCEDFNDMLVHHVGLRYVSITNYYCLNLVYTSMLSVLWNLQTLVLQACVVLPCEIWDMPQLRHLVVEMGVLPHPPVACAKGNDIMIMKNLQSLYGPVMSISEEVVGRIQNLESLELNCGNCYLLEGECAHCSLLNNDCSLTNLAQLHKLKFVMLRLCKVEEIIFPNSLVNLNLCALQNPSKALTIIGTLPNLEVLKLNNINYWPEWIPFEGQFLRLKRLMLHCCGLECWLADHTHFPILKWLKLDQCKELQEIPLAIGDIATLCLIEVTYCSKSVDDSVKQIWEEQQNYGNESLQIQIVGTTNKYVFGDLQFIDTWKDWHVSYCACQLILDRTYQWKSKRQQEILFSKLIEALRNGGASDPKRMMEATDRVLATMAKGHMGWSRAILKNHIKLKFMKKNNIMKRQSKKMMLITHSSSKLQRKSKVKLFRLKSKVKIFRLKSKTVAALWRKAQHLGRLVPGCWKQPFPVVLEEATDYIAALEMQMKALRVVAGLLNCR